MSSSGPAPANAPQSPVVATPPHGRWVAAHALFWCLAAPLLGVAAARVAVWAERVRAPLLIFPLLVGCGLGLLLVALMRLANVGHRPTIIVAAVLAVVPAIAGQHFFSYRDYLHDRAEFLAQNSKYTLLEALQDRGPAAAPSFIEYMSGQARVGRPLFEIGGAPASLHGVAAWASWIVDGLITLLSTVVVVCLTTKKSTWLES